ncbi:MAG: tnpA repressor protein TnpC, partial [Pseudomonas sp. BRH_c35]
LTIVEGIALTVPAESACIWAEAESLQMDLEALVSWARAAQLLIAPLIDLAPNHGP